MRNLVNTSLLKILNKNRSINGYFRQAGCFRHQKVNLDSGIAQLAGT
jgi:hypothetical protein